MNLSSLLIISFLSFQSFIGRFSPIIGDCELVINSEVIKTIKGKAVGEIKLDISGGGPPYEVKWIAYGFSQNGNHIKHLKEGYYSALVVDSNRCAKMIENIYVESKPENE